MKTYTTKELKEVLKKYPVGYNEYKFGQAYADFSNSDLHKANLSTINFTCANFNNSDLTEADLSNAHFNHADMQNADLRWANLSGAHLNDADLTGADLRCANLTHTCFTETKLSRVNLSEANLKGAYIAEGDLFYIEKQPIILLIEKYPVIIFDNHMEIWCPHQIRSILYTHDQWRRKSMRKELEKLDGNDAIIFWKKYKSALTALCKSMREEN